MTPLRVLWTHNFAQEKPNSLVFINPAAAAIRARGVALELEYLGNLRSVVELVAARRRVRALSREFDIVHAQYGSACALASEAAEGVPKVVSVRGNDWNLHSYSFGFHYGHTRLARAMTRWSIGRYDCVLSVSNRMTAELRRFASRVETLPSPIDLTRFVPRDKAEARALLGHPGNSKKWVLFNALRLDDPIKRFPLAKAAFDLANARSGNLELRLAHGLAHDELPLFAAACDVILCTSETEGWPNSVKEALACNVPFVSTDVSDLPDIARLEPSCRISPPDPEAIAVALREALASTERPDLRKYVAGMTPDAASDHLMAVYTRAVSQHRRDSSNALASPIEA